MLHGLRKKWNVNKAQFVRIIITFAVGGSSCGILGKKLMLQLPSMHPLLYAFSYLVVVTVLWPLCVLVVSWCTGEFLFFKHYIGSILRRLF